MTRKDYILLAEALRDTMLIDCPAAFNSASSGRPSTPRWLTRITDALEVDNPRFDREHFLAVVRGEKSLNSRPSRKIG